jgi:hypothetical protein
MSLLELAQGQTYVDQYDTVGGASCCRDLALPVGLLRKIDREWTRTVNAHEWTRRNISTADGHGFARIRVWRLRRGALPRFLRR